MSIFCIATHLPSAGTQNIKMNSLKKLFIRVKHARI